MKHQILCVLAIVALVVCGVAGTTSAAPFYDHFEGETLDSAKWTTSLGSGSGHGTASVTVANSIVNVESGLYANINSIPTWSGADNATATFTVGAAFSGNNDTFGFCNNYSASAPVIIMRNDSGSGGDQFKFYVANESLDYYSPAVEYTLGAGSKVAFTWTQTSVILAINDVVVDSASTVIPTGPISLSMGTWLSGGGTHMDLVTVVVPEPSCVVLLAAGLFGLLGSARRKQR